MQFFKKTIGLIAVLCMVPAAFAAPSRSATATLSGTTTGRVSANNTAASRISIAGYIKNAATSTTAVSDDGTVTITAASLMNNSECIDAYSECIKSEDACGIDFEECTSKKLFHVKMPSCLGTLAQCSDDGVKTLFGTKNIGNLSEKDGDNYIYPLDGSYLGNLISAAKSANMYDTATCVRRYTNCIRGESVCGSDFELCTTKTAFQKQALLCESTLERCESEGKVQLFGSTSSANIQDGSRIAELITEGADLAAVNSVSTCYKTVDNCILSACAKNPYRCSENTSKLAAALVEAKQDPETYKNILDENGTVTKSDIHGFVKNACMETIGTNKYCYGLYNKNQKGKMPKTSELNDPDVQLDLFEAAYNDRMNDSLMLKIADLVKKFDAKAKSSCADTVKSCAMRVCGGGSGAACYATVLGSARTNAAASINASGKSGDGTYEEIKSACEMIVNSDVNCQYAYVSDGADAANSYESQYVMENVFAYVFPKYSDTGATDPIGVVATLNASLANSYNNTAIDQLKKQCQATVKACVNTMCGDDYAYCYRNRNDIYTDTYSTANNKFNNSMNKVNGILDYTVIRGLCMDTIKNSSACEEHLKIQSTKVADPTIDSVSGWGTNKSTRDAWGNIGKTAGLDNVAVVVGCKTATKDSKFLGMGNKCDPDDVQPCGTVKGNCVYDQEYTDTTSNYKLSKASETVLSEVLSEIEMVAQAQYNAKLTHEQSMCVASNNGGITSANDMGRTFMWVKLKSKNIPNTYTVSGLKTSEFQESNDIYGSFCRVRVTLQSDDPAIQSVMNGKDWATAYFATGDSFTCGSWIPESALQAMAAKKTTTNANGDLTAGQWWAVAGASILSAVGGAIGTDALQTETGLGGLLGTTTNLDTAKKLKSAASSCKSALNSASSKTVCSADWHRYVNSALSAVSGKSEFKAEYDELMKYNACTTSTDDAVAAAVSALSYKCYEIADKDVSDLKEETTGWTKRHTADAIGAGVGALTGGVATFQTIKASNVAKYNEAEQEFMNTIGQHISCYIGGDEAGSYGDVVTTSIE